MTEQGLDQWRRLRRRLAARWWIYIILGFIGATLFVHNLNTNEPSIFAFLALIPILAFRGAWKTDRLMIEVDQKISDHFRKNPIVDS